MAENLAYLPVVHSNSEFETQGNNDDPGYGVYGYDGSDLATAKAASIYSTYGVLYNWYAVDQVSICPVGWHLPSDAEQHILDDHFAAGTCDSSRNNSFDCNPAGDQLKGDSAGDWCAGSPCGESGFEALAGGYRFAYGSFGHGGTSAYFWSSSPSGDNALRRRVGSSGVGVNRHAFSRALGLSVRCLRDI
jgi:uncharacterized protein (TIGR02145 family)